MCLCLVVDSTSDGSLTWRWGAGAGAGAGACCWGGRCAGAPDCGEGGTIESALDARLGRDRVYGRFEGGNERWNRLGIDKGMSGAAVERT